MNKSQGGDATSTLFEVRSGRIVLSETAHHNADGAEHDARTNRSKEVVSGDGCDVSNRRRSTQS